MIYMECNIAAFLTGTTLLKQNSFSKDIWHPYKIFHTNQQLSLKNIRKILWHIEHYFHLHFKASTVISFYNLIVKVQKKFFLTISSAKCGDKFTKKKKRRKW